MLKTMIKSGAVALAPIMAFPAVMADEAVHTERQIVITVEVVAPVEECWRLWATEHGLESFLAPDVDMDPRVGGALSVYFNPEQAPGLRGAEEMVVLSMEAPTRLSFTWNAPPRFPHARSQLAVVTVRFAEVDEGHTKVSLIHDHFGDGYDWDETFKYFIAGWSQSVMPRFVYAAENGGVNWRKYAAENGGVNWSAMNFEPIEPVVVP